MKTLLAIVLLAILGASDAAAQRVWRDTFQVRLEKKTPNHPYYQKGWDSAYTIDGVEAANVTLVRGWTYYFQFKDVPRKARLWLWIGDSHEWLEGTSPYLPWGDVLWRFTPPATIPDRLYYLASAENSDARPPQTGGTFYFVDSTSLNAVPNLAARRSETATEVWPNPSSSLLHIGYSIDRSETARLVVVDDLGREVYADQQTTNPDAKGAFVVDSRRFAPGVYLYRITSESSPAVLAGAFVIMR